MRKRPRHGNRPDDGRAAALFREYAGELHAFLRRRMSSVDSADDVFQTVFERMIKVSKMDLVQKPNAYLFGIAVHVVREFKLRDQRDARVLAFDSETANQASERPDQVIEDDSEALNLRRQLDEALAELPENHRKVLLACKRDGMTYDEAARATGISRPMVEKYLIQARAKMMALQWER